MKQLYKFRSKYCLNATGIAFIFCTLTWKTATNHLQSIQFRSTLTSITDTVPRLLKTDSTKRLTFTGSDTSRLPGDSSRIQRVDTFSLRFSKDSLEAPLRYSADDSVVVLIKDKKILLYGKTRTEYEDITLTAPRVEMDQQTQIVTATNKRDSTGAITENAHFKQGEHEFTSDTIRFNFKTQKGLTKNTYTKDGEIFVIGDRVKKVDAITSYIQRARFTTCDLDDPHFAFLTKRMKVINNKLAVSGLIHPEFEGVPVPIYLPFGFFPLSQGRHSGFLPPLFSTNEQYGLGLEGLGYYKVLSPYWDAKIYGNIYSYGGWSLNINPTYRHRYKYYGAFNLSMQSTHINFKGDPDFLKTRTFFITWSHAVDSKARPGTSFSANVNAGSTKYNQYIPNNPQLNFQNQLGSSITYSKSWAGKPYNLTLSANHFQNSTNRLININLPDAGFSVSTIYPFQPKNEIGTPKWWSRTGIGYSGSLRNQFSFYDSAFSFKRVLDTMQWGAQHSIPITLTLPPAFGGALIVAPSISYSQVWIAQKLRRTWNPTTKKLDTTITKGFFTDHYAQFGLGLSTALYGTYQFKRSRLMAIRHIIRPSMNINYKPDLSKSHFYDMQVDTTGYKRRFREFDGGLYPGYPEGQFGGMSFQVDNNLEMKLRSKKDTSAEGIKHVRLVDGYGAQVSYNFFADSFKLSQVTLYFRTNLFEKLSLSASGTLDPYKTNSRGIDINKYAWTGGKFSLGRLSSGSISMSTSFSSKPKDPKKDELRKQQVKDRLNDPAVIADQQRLLDYMKQNPAEFVDFNIPWQVSLSYSLFYRQIYKSDFTGFKNEFSSNLNFQGSFNLTPKWNFSVNGYYDLDTRKMQTFQMSINREMHCWQLAINVVPIGLYRSFSFSLSPKASVLQDLRINRTRYFSNY